MNISDKTIPEIKNMLDTVSETDRVELLSFLEQDPRAGARKLAASCRAAAERAKTEETTLAGLMKYESKLNAQGFKLVAGVDEAGRGALAGPLVAAAAILPENARINGLRDSKQLTPEKREALYDTIIETAIAWNVVCVPHDDIDRYGIQWANLYGLERAAADLRPEADFVLSDAFELPNVNIPSLAVIKGDSKSLSIAAASVLAKVTRDRIMIEYHEQYPEYAFEQHKGYGTAIHQNLIRQYGVSPIHRMCFAPCSDYKQLTLGT